MDCYFRRVQIKEDVAEGGCTCRRLKLNEGVAPRGCTHGRMQLKEDVAQEEWSSINMEVKWVYLKDIAKGWNKRPLIVDIRQRFKLLQNNT